MNNLTITNLDAIAYHLEQGEDNGGISKKALALFLRSVSNLAKFEMKQKSILEPFLNVADKLEECGDRVELQVNSLYLGPINGLKVKDFRNIRKLVDGNYIVTHHYGEVRHYGEIK